MGKTPIYGKGGEILGYTDGVVGSIPLASRLHEFKSPTLLEAYQDIEGMDMLNPVGAGILSQIPYLKDKLITELYPMRKPSRLISDATGYYYLRKLSRSERKEYIKEFKLANRYFSIRDWLTSTCYNMEDFIYSSFSLAYSVKGADYWERIATRARWATKPSPLSSEQLYEALVAIQEEMNNKPLI